MISLLTLGYFYNSLRSQKENLKLAEAQEEQRLLRGQKKYIEKEMRKFRRKKMITLHELENQLLRDVSRNNFWNFLQMPDFVLLCRS
jgi:hypothetical protein